jgi:DNA-binding MarR family transcriptional regulator
MAHVGISQATASGLVDGLVSEGLVRRAPDPSDGRAKRLVATDAGVATAAAWRHAYVQVVETIFGALPMDDRQSLARMLQRLTDSALAVSGPGDAGG